MKAIAWAVLFGFGAMLAVVIGPRLSDDAAAVILGVFVGIAASVPVAIGMILVIRRAQTR